MNLLWRHHRWFAAAAGIILASGVVSLFAHKGAGLTAFADIFGLLLMLLAASATLANLLTRPAQERSFWALMTFGFLLWSFNEGFWVVYEVMLHRSIPDPNFSDVILFFHVVPMVAAVAWRPDLAKKEERIFLSALNFLMLLGWWVLLYAFIVFPHQYVVLNVHLYDTYFDDLYLLENGFLLLVLGMAAFSSSGGWQRLYCNLLAAEAVYGVGSRVANRALARGTYYSGSLYDVPLVAAIVWMAAMALSARNWNLQVEEFKLNPRWKKVVPRMAMLAILSLPALGLWTVWFDPSPAQDRVFRIYTVLTGMLLLGVFVFLSQYAQDQKLMGLLQESRVAFETQKKLQIQLVQKEKLASLGTLVAGAAHEIDHPLTAIMNSSEQLWAQEQLSDEQNTLLRKIVNHAQRSRDLVANLLRFARHSPGEKGMLDLSLLLQRAAQMTEWRYANGKIQVQISIEPQLPQIWGNMNQLFQAFVEITENAMDALQEAGGGSLQIRALAQGGEVVIEFSDSGPGIRDPLRVFDPFYTTKPVGKGTGLGLSVVYGVVQDHGGQIACQNKPEGGALFALRFPIATESAVRVAGASGD
jgi:signal transduction histidine kinase